ncbi:MAG: hypothetical protein QXS18_06440 [Thermoplasmata archaeon]
MSTSDCDRYVVIAGLVRGVKYVDSAFAKGAIIESGLKLTRFERPSMEDMLPAIADGIDNGL